MMHLVDSARGALKLYALHLRHPGTVSAEQAAQAGQDALTRLDLMHSSAFTLAEAYSAVRAVLPAHLTVAVAPGNAEGKSLMVMILDGPHLLQTIHGNTPKGVVELLRVAKEAA